MSVTLGLGERAEAILKAIEPELKQEHEKRSQTTVKVKKGMLSIHINALDQTALRASLNGYLRLVLTANQLAEVIR
jgi:tRNA threonylcarbamoyladenosine modification (KEOPS) complex  Pcc1 subunit